jgi:hypothetical protein
MKWLSIMAKIMAKRNEMEAWRNSIVKMAKTSKSVIWLMAKWRNESISDMSKTKWHGGNNLNVMASIMAKIRRNGIESGNNNGQWLININGVIIIIIEISAMK